MSNLTPQTANTIDEVCKLKRDNISTPHSWLLMGSKNDLTIANQRSGGNIKGMVKLTKKEFERFIKFYQTGK